MDAQKKRKETKNCVKLTTACLAEGLLMNSCSPSGGQTCRRPQGNSGSVLSHLVQGAADDFMSLRRRHPMERANCIEGIILNVAQVQETPFLLGQLLHAGRQLVAHFYSERFPMKRTVSLPLKRRFHAGIVRKQNAFHRLPI